MNLRSPFRSSAALFAVMVSMATQGPTPTGAAEPAVSQAATLVRVRKIWDRAPHNAFTDLLNEKGRWFCVFREGQGHVSPDGAIQILTSVDGERWESATRLTSTNSDLRDPKITRTSDGRLMITAAGALHPPAGAKHRSMVWFSPDGREWQGPNLVADPNLWLWRVTWHRGRAYGVGYDTDGEKFIRLYSSSTGRDFTSVVSTLLAEENPNETALVFLPDDRALCLLRRDGKPGNGLLGVASPPYTQWEWKDLGRKIGGPVMILLPDGRLIGGVRLYDGKVRTALISIDAATGATRELLSLPSNGDSSYPGLVWHEGELWVSYYSSHEGKTSIYLARVRL